MLFARIRGRLLATFALVMILAVAAIGWFCIRPAESPLERGHRAYARGDWSTALGLARTRLKSKADDPSALRLLARSMVRLGRDSSAMAVYHRLGPQAMLPDDLCLLGIALTRTGNGRGVELWEQSLAADPTHAETLFELTRTLIVDDQL